MRTAIWTCFRNGCVRGLTRAPPLRDRPGLTRKFSFSSRAMTRRLTSERADTRAAEGRSHPIVSTRKIANKQRRPSATHIAAPSLGRLKFIGKDRRAAPAHVAQRHFRTTTTCEIQCADKPLRPKGASERQFALSRHPQPPILLGLLHPTENCKFEERKRQKFRADTCRQFPTS